MNKLKSTHRFEFKKDRAMILEIFEWCYENDFDMLEFVSHSNKPISSQKMKEWGEFRSGLCKKYNKYEMGEVEREFLDRQEGA